jgi:hypothetical protein
LSRPRVNDTAQDEAEDVARILSNNKNAPIEALEPLKQFFLVAYDPPKQVFLIGHFSHLPVAVFT